MLQTFIRRSIEPAQRAMLVALSVITVVISSLSTGQATAAMTIPGQEAAIINNQLNQINGTVPRPPRANIINWPDKTCPRCNVALGEAAAVSAYATPNAGKLAYAEWIFDQALHLAPQPGLMTPATNELGPGEATMFYIDELGPSLNMLRPQLDQAHIVSYTNAITNAADWLQADGDYSYYSNGNVNIGIAGVAALAYQQTGNPTYLGYYNKTMAFMANPTQPRWKGYGWVVSQQPTSATGVDGAGYFTETGRAGTGLDIDYTQLQVDQLARIWLINHDPKILYYMNMEINTLLAKTNTTTWGLDSSGGTRHPQTNPRRIISFDSVAYQVLANNGRSDLRANQASELAAINRFLSSPGGYAPGYYYDLGLLPSVLAMASTNLRTTVHTPAVTTDVTPPAQPQLSQIIARSPTAVTVTWKPDADNVGVVKYYIRRNSPTAGGIIGTVDGTTYTDTTTTAHTVYKYSVFAADAAGNVSGISTGLTVMTP